MSSPLVQVVTIGEAAQMFSLTIWAIQYRIDKGHIRYRKTDSIYLVALDDLISLYGKPIANLPLRGELTKSTPKQKTPRGPVQTNPS
jgi:hypothetical protein